MEGTEQTHDGVTSPFSTGLNHWNDWSRNSLRFSWLKPGWGLPPAGSSTCTPLQTGASSPRHTECYLGMTSAGNGPLNGCLHSLQPLRSILPVLEEPLRLLLPDRCWLQDHYTGIEGAAWTLRAFYRPEFITHSSKTDREKCCCGAEIF